MEQEETKYYQVLRENNKGRRILLRKSVRKTHPDDLCLIKSKVSRL